MSGPRALPNGDRNRWQDAAGRVGAAVGAVVGALASVGWLVLVGALRWLRAHPRFTTVAGTVLIGALLGGLLGAGLVVAGWLLGLWWVLVGAPDAVAKAFSRRPTDADPVPARTGQVRGPAWACPACGREHPGHVLIVGPDPQGAFHCAEIQPQRRDYL